MPAGAGEGDLVAIAADTDASEPQTRTIDRNEVVDLAFQTHVEHMLDSAQVAQSFLADIRRERDRTRSDYFGLVERADYSDQHSQAAAVVGDARTLHDRAGRLVVDVHFRPKDRIEMRREQ